jgi:hypothetical protein
MASHAQLNRPAGPTFKVSATYPYGRAGDDSQHSGITLIPIAPLQKRIPAKWNRSHACRLFSVISAKRGESRLPGIVWGTRLVSSWRQVKPRVPPQSKPAVPISIAFLRGRNPRRRGLAGRGLGWEIMTRGTDAPTLPTPTPAPPPHKGNKREGRGFPSCQALTSLRRQ